MKAEVPSVTDYDNECFKYNSNYLDDMKHIEHSPFLELEEGRRCFSNREFRKSDNKELINIVIDYDTQTSLDRKTKQLKKFVKELDKKNKYKNSYSEISNFEDRGRKCIKVVWEGILPKVMYLRAYSDFKDLQLQQRNKYFAQFVWFECTHPGKKRFIQDLGFKRYSIELEPDPNFEQEATDFFNNLEFTYK